MSFMSMLGGIGKLVESLMSGSLMGAGKDDAQQMSGGESEETGGLGKLAEKAKEESPEGSETETAKASEPSESAEDAEGAEASETIGQSEEEDKAEGEKSGGLFGSLLGAVGSIFKGGQGVFDRKRSISQRIFSGLGMAGGLLGGLGSIFGKFGNKKTGKILGGIGSFLNMFGGLGGGDEAEEEKTGEDMTELEDMEESGETEDAKEGTEEAAEGTGETQKGVEEVSEETGETKEGVGKTLEETGATKESLEEAPKGTEISIVNENEEAQDAGAAPAAAEGKSESALAEEGAPTLDNPVKEAVRRRRRRRRKRRKHRRR